MDKFIMHVDDCWDLDAVVRGHTSRGASSSATCDMVEWFNSFINDDDDPLIRSNSGWDHGFPLDDFPAGFPDETTLSMVYDELKGLCNDPVEMLPASPKSAMVVNFGSTASNNVETSYEGDQDEKKREGAGSSPADPSVGVDDAVHVAAKYKRRKNQQKQVVKQVAADGISSDLWAWRKYGQKPIKGSPYPRSYYRCSSSKGCVARKQVERSTSKPGMFIVTYTGEHSHSKPTRRSALAGITRPSKFSATKKPTKHETLRSSVPVPKSPHEMSSNNHGDTSPTSTSTSTLDDGARKLEAFVWGESGKSFNEIMNPPSVVFGEELFLGFDELERLGMDFALTGIL